MDEAVGRIFREAWKVTAGRVVPDEAGLTLSNTGVAIDAAVLYADLAGSTRLVDGRSREFAAEVYKAFLLCAARIVRSEGGTVTAYDGDRIMAVFIGETRRTAAVRTALKINWARVNVIQPRLDAQYPGSGYVLAHTCGIDASSLMAAKTGVRGANDLVWVGRAANHAAKLSAESSATPTWITAEVYDNMLEQGRMGGQPKRNMWTPMSWTAMGGARVYCSSWTWSFS